MSLRTLGNRRDELRVQLTAWLDVALSVLAVPFLVLLVIELAVSPGKPWGGRIVIAQTAIWAVFALAFLAELAIARSKLNYLRANWLVALSLALPLLRVFRVVSAIRVLRGARAMRGLHLARIVTRVNRASRSIRQLVRVSQFAYLVLLTTLVTFSVAAGVTYFEREIPVSDLGTYGEALWWAASVVMSGDGSTTPLTLEARVLTVGLRIFGLAVFGYLTARIAVFFLSEHADAGDPSRDRELRRLADEVARLSDRLTGASPAGQDRAVVGEDRPSGDGNR